MLHIKRIIPRYTQVITTANRYEKDDYNGSPIVEKGHFKGDIKQYQTVIAVGKTVRELEVGTQVMLDFEPYRKRKVPVNSIKEKMDVDNPIVEEHLPLFEMDDENGNTSEFLMMDERNVVFPFEGEEVEDESQSNLILPSKKIIV